MYRFSSRAETRTATRTLPCAFTSPKAAAGGVPDALRSTLIAPADVGATDTAGLLAAATGTGVDVAALSLGLGLMLVVAVALAAGGGCESLVDCVGPCPIGAGFNLEELLPVRGGGPPLAAGEDALAGALGVGATEGRPDGAGGGCFEGGCGKRLGALLFVVGGSEGAEVMT